MEAISKTKTREMQREVIESDDFNRVLSAFNATENELMWRKDKNGFLYISDSLDPEMIARVTVTRDSSVGIAIADVNDVPIEWHELDTI